MTQDRNFKDVVFFPGENNFGLQRKIDKFVKEKNNKKVQN